MDNKQLFAVEAQANHQLYLSTNRVMASDDEPPIQTMNMLETGNEINYVAYANEPLIKWA